MSSKNRGIGQASCVDRCPHDVGRRYQICLVLPAGRRPGGRPADVLGCLPQKRHLKRPAGIRLCVFEHRSIGRTTAGRLAGSVRSKMTKPADGPMFPRRPADLIVRASAARPAGYRPSDGSVNPFLKGGNSLSLPPGRFCIGRSSWDVVGHRPGIGYVSSKSRGIGRASCVEPMPARRRPAVSNIFDIAGQLADARPADVLGCWLLGYRPAAGSVSSRL